LGEARIEKKGQGMTREWKIASHLPARPQVPIWQLPAHPRPFSRLDTAARG